jgi:hypothetical protein
LQKPEALTTSGWSSLHFILFLFIKGFAPASGGQSYASPNGNGRSFSIQSGDLPVFWR